MLLIIKIAEVHQRVLNPILRDPTIFILKSFTAPGGWMVKSIKKKQPLWAKELIYEQKGI